MLKTLTACALISMFPIRLYGGSRVNLRISLDAMVLSLLPVLKRDPFLG